MSAPASLPRCIAEWEHYKMRGLLIVSLAAGLTGCNAILSIPDQVEILCESGQECPGGFCGETFTCDEKQWALALGDAEDQQVHDVAWYDPDREGEQLGLLLLAGSFKGQLDLGPDHRFESTGDWDAYVLALDSTGRTVWAQHFGGPGEQRAMGIIVGDEGTVFVAGPLGGDTDFGTRSLTTTPDRADGFVARLEFDDGDVVWAERFGGTDVLSIEDMAVIGQNPVVVGSYRGPWRSGPEDAGDTGSLELGYLVTFDATGSASASSGFGATEGLRACCVLVDPLTDSLLVGGDYQGELSLNGNVVSSADVPGYIFVIADDGAGGTSVSMLGLGQPLDAFGTDSLARLAIGMRTSNEPGVGVFRVLSDQVSEAVRATSPDSTARLVALTNNRDNATLALGQFSGSLEVVEGPSFQAEDQDLFVLTIDEQWRVPPGRSWAFGGPGEVTPVGIAADDEGHVMLVGMFDGTLDLSSESGTVTLRSSGGTDVFVAQLRL